MKNDINKQLIEACINGNLEEVNRLIAAGADVNAKDKDGFMALMEATIKGHAEIAKILLSAGANPNVEYQVGFTVLIEAAVHGYAEVVKVLLDGEANPYAVADDGRTVLRIANDGWSKAETQEKAFEYKRVVEMLQAAGARE